MTLQNTISPQLKKYVYDYILPQYHLNDKGHGTDHIRYVVRRCLEFSKKLIDIDTEIIYVIAVYHDIGHSIDKENHEILSAEMFMNDEFMKSYFSESSRLIIKEAIEDHRASASHPPRSEYGKIISSADRSTNVDEFLLRTHAYTLTHCKCKNVDEIIRRAYDHTYSKYGSDGYAKSYLEDEEYTKFLNTVRYLLENEERFKDYYKNLTKIQEEIWENSKEKA